MENDILTVEQIAEILDLHPKTIRRFIQDGRLKAHKIGKQWRITREDLKNFVGRKDDSNTIKGDDQSNFESFVNNTVHEIKQKVQVSTVIDIFVEDAAEAVRITNTLFAMLNCKDPSYGSSRCDHIFYKNEMKARYILWGSPRFISNVLDCISAISENK